MGSMKLDLRSASKNFHQSVEQFYAAAFGPSVALYRLVSLCGWRPLAASGTPAFFSKERWRQDPETSSAGRSSGIEVYETSDGMTIEVALSNIKEESLHLAIAGNRVLIRGERIALGRAAEPLPAHLRASSQFQHFIQLPATVRTGGFRAQLKGDIVRIDFAKRR